MSDWGDIPPIVIDERSRQPKYVQFARALEGHIREGIVEPHTRLPSENDLYHLLGLSRSTIRKSLEELERKGLVYRRHGQGTFVADQVDNSATEIISIGIGKTDPVGLANTTGEKGGTRGLIGLLIPTMTNEIYPQIIQGVEDVAAAHNWTVFVGNTYANRERELVLLQQMIERQVNGLILEPTHARFDQPGTKTFQLLKSYPLPCVLIANDIPGLEMSRVILDDVGGGRLATEHLISRGHKRIAYIYKESVLAALDRRDGFIAAHEKAGLVVHQHFLRPYTEDEDKHRIGYSFTRELLAMPDRPTAIFYFNDNLALQGLKAIKDLGLSVPKDVSVIGFDNIQSAATAGLTSIEHPKYYCGRWAADILFDKIIFGGSSIRRRIMVYPELVERESVCPPGLR